VTSIAPFFVWDQYRQAREGTQAIVEQVQRLHVLRDSLLHAPSTRLLFTTVGHSLGGGLAEDVFLHNPQITKVVAFDASPANGASAVAIQDRGDVMRHTLRTVDHDRPGSDAAIHLLYESGSILSDVAQCSSGPLWGDEGGPLVKCNRVNLSRGTPFRQHNMAQFACKLFLLARDDNAAPPKVQP
jgi:pimeloyl-ACP methyl ester carboxylesterase